MDRLTQESLLRDLDSGECNPPAIDAQAEVSGKAAGPSAEERLARIVHAIETDIIPKLLQVHRQVPHGTRQAPEHPRPTHEDRTQFMASLLARDDGDWQVHIERLLLRGVSIDDIYEGLLGPSAAVLGTMWENDQCTFTDVTVAMGRLQRTMRTLSPAFGRSVQFPPDGRRVLLLPAPGEQHTFGLSIVSEFFRRAGWDVVGDTEVRAADPAALVRSEWFDVIGISVGHDARLDWLRSGIAAVRNASRNRSIGVLVGGPVFVGRQDRATEVGADGTSEDGRHAPVVAEQLMEQRLLRV